MDQRLLAPVDGSELSERAMQAGIELPRQLGASILGFVAEPLPPLRSERYPVVASEEMLLAHDAMTAAHAGRVLARFTALAQAAGVEFTGFHDQTPRIDQAIVSIAEAQGCDMIVMVTHGRGPFGEFLFGSQTKAVLAGSQLPLLVLH